MELSLSAKSRFDAAARMMRDGDDDVDSKKKVTKTGDIVSKEKRAKISERRVLVFSTRGLVSRFRHLMLDIRKLLPHHKKDAKFDMRNNFHEIVEICEMKSCRNCLFFECRKKKDLYLWASHTPNGPAVKFHVTNIHTMAELKFTGNCLLGSRPILVFDKVFDTFPQWKLIKELFTQMFAPPVDHPKSKPFVDHVVSFFIVDGRIWFRHYQIVTRTESDAVKAARALKKGKEGQFEETKSSLIEIGPRFVMDVVRVFDGSFGGKTLFQNPSFLAPNAMRHKEHKRKSKKYQDRLQSREKRRKHVNANPVPRDVLDTVFG